MGARPQMHFTIFDQNAPGIPTDKPKGTIELIYVTDQYSIGKIVKTINQDGTAVLLVEQDVVLALEIADRGYVLENGRITMSGRADELRRDPAVRKAYLGV